MASVVISLDTTSRQSMLSIDGEIIPSSDIFFSRWFDEDGNQFLRFSYVTETKNDSGLMERRQFFLPDPDDNILAKVMENGLCCSDECEGLTEAQKDVVTFMRNKK